MNPCLSELAPLLVGFKELGIEPVGLEGYVIDYLRSYRSGGYDTGATAGASTDVV